MEEKKICFYSRVSTDRQNLDNQLICFQTYAKQNNIPIDDCLSFSDITSGIYSNRPQLDEMREAIYRQEIKTLIIWKLDRLGRSLRDLLNWFDLLQKYNITFISLTDGIDTTTASGKLMFSILGSIAEFERSLLQERTSLAMERRKALGLAVGRPLGCKDKRKRRVKGYIQRHLRDTKKRQLLFGDKIPNKFTSLVSLQPEKI
ncbi:MAG: recombinase family protein [Candidatus Omnitrophota bacterium]|nr:recombinase family protein [Candidatus Omnitrophota bacterium]